MKNFLVKVKGITPLIMHSCAGADPQNKYNVELKPLKAKRKKTDADNQKIRDLSFLQSLYWDDELGGLYMPTENIQKMILEAGRHLDQKGAKKLFVGIGFTQYLGFPLIAKHHDNLAEISKDEELRYTKIVQVQKAKVVAVRAMFKNWTFEFDIEVDETIINPSTVEEWINYAGKRIGLGSRRPYAPTPGPFGKFIVESFEEIT